jgi:hypothetical protein
MHLHRVPARCPNAQVAPLGSGDHPDDPSWAVVTLFGEHY